MSIIKDLMCLHLCVNVKVDCEFAFLQKGEQFCSKSHYTSYGEGGGGDKFGKNWDDGHGLLKTTQKTG